jgi:hypothetical protein
VDKNPVLVVWALLVDCMHSFLNLDILLVLCVFGLAFCFLLLSVHLKHLVGYGEVIMAVFIEERLLALGLDRTELFWDDCSVDKFVDCLEGRVNLLFFCVVQTQVEVLQMG